MAEIPLGGAIVETMAARDPAGRTILVGGAALYLQMEAAGLPGLPTPDTDALCSPSHFDELLLIGPHMPNVAEFRVGYPTGKQREMGATAPYIAMKADPDFAPGVLPFSVTVQKGSPLVIAKRHAELVAQPHRLREVGDTTCLNAAEILEWKAMLGRRKDLRAVHKAMPLVLAAGLITREERDKIRHEVAASWKARRDHPNRYYARIDTRL
jgi:hypothetical protein